MENTISKSFRLPQNDAIWLQDLANKTGNTQTDIISRCIANARQNDGKLMIKDILSDGGITEDDEARDILTALGIATASGFAGYHITGFIRKQLDLDEDKGTQLLMGVLAGMGALLMKAYHSNKEQ